jgi:hypothetical protein
MKFILHKGYSDLNVEAGFWNGKTALPDEINVIARTDNRYRAELELLSTLCSLHGYVTAFDLLSGTADSTEKDKDITAILIALRLYVHPKIPLTNYSNDDTRLKTGVFALTPVKMR